MLRLVLTGGAPDEPDTGDWNAICEAPGPQRFLETLFQELAGFGLPAPVITEDGLDDIRRVRTGWRGSAALGAKISQVECTETTDLPTLCSWETHGVPGMELRWEYALEYAGQLGHTAFRHRRLECSFESEADRERFAGIWRRVFGREPVFEPHPDRR
ncbi:MAG TPA: hypothetical protein VEG08_11805 [Terriglobales bacterium]|nr:hypothetical protein [Terriglobales bacterium]